MMMNNYRMKYFKEWLINEAEGLNAGDVFNYISEKDPTLVDSIGEGKLRVMIGRYIEQKRIDVKGFNFETTPPLTDSKSLAKILIKTLRNDQRTDYRDRYDVRVKFQNTLWGEGEDGEEDEESVGGGGGGGQASSGISMPEFKTIYESMNFDTPLNLDRVVEFTNLVQRAEGPPNNLRKGTVAAILTDPQRINYLEQFINSGKPLPHHINEFRIALAVIISGGVENVQATTDDQEESQDSSGTQTTGQTIGQTTGSTTQEGPKGSLGAPRTDEATQSGGYYTLQQGEAEKTKMYIKKFKELMKRGFFSNRFQFNLTPGQVEVEKLGSTLKWTGGNFIFAPTMEIIGYATLVRAGTVGSSEVSTLIEQFKLAVGQGVLKYWPQLVNQQKETGELSLNQLYGPKGQVLASLNNAITLNWSKQNETQSN